MKPRFKTAPLLLALLACAAIPVTAGESSPPVPSASQADWLDAGIGVFVHWAPNVYQGGEGDNLSTPRERINPDRFEAAKIVRAAKSAHAGYLIFVAKHVGGYCAWQTETTDYSIKTSPWKGGRGDMVADFAKACRDQGLRFGVYLSPRSDIHQVGSGGHASNVEKQAEYNAIYQRQLTELLTNYGPMFEMWFDGGNIVPVNDVIDRLAPGIITFQGRRANSTRWVGTEHGFAPYPCWNTIDWKPGETPKEGAGSPTGRTWCPAECDVSILRPAWFWREGSDSRIISLEDLVEIYYMSVGRGVNLLLNITPDGHGEVPEAQVRRLAEFGAEIDARFSQPLATTKGEGKSVMLDLGAARTVDHVTLREDIRQGERVRKFVVEGQRPNKTWMQLAGGTQIGNRQIIPIAPVSVTALRLTIAESVAPPVIREFSVFSVNRPVPKGAFREGGSPLMREPVVTRSRDGIYAMDCPTPDWEIHYTLDGSEPTRRSTIYREPQRFAPGQVLKARYFVADDGEAPGGPVVVRPIGLAPSQIREMRCSSQEDDTPATAAFDGDPKTMWHTAWRKSMAPPPHEIVLDLGKSQNITGLGYLARQDAVGNFPSAIRIWVSDNPDNFPTQPGFEGGFGEFKTAPQAWHRTAFPKPLAGRYLRLVYVDEVNHSKCVASAEIEVYVGR